MAAANRTQLTYRVDESTLERLDEAIWQCKVAGVIDRDASRSDVLRDHLHELIDELEEQADAAESDE